MTIQIHKGANWNKKNDPFTQMFFAQNLKQFWLEEEIKVSDDKNTWHLLSAAEQTVYKKVLSGLTTLDTKQGSEGMPLISIHVEDFQQKAVLSFMGAMEHIHAKSYSRIFTTLATEKEIDELFAWSEMHPSLQKKANIVAEIYLRLLCKNPTTLELYQAMVASVFLESFLFYSGFFYPLYLAGQGKMVHSGEIINLILRDESIHGVYVGLLAKDLFKTLSPTDQELAKLFVHDLLDELYENELTYTNELYSKIGLVDEVNEFIRYNANKALSNLGYDDKFHDVHLHPVIENGLKTDTKTHDFFSVKGNSYFKAVNVTPITDDVFDFWEEK